MDFSERLLNWYENHGRHDLPWQQNRTLYSVWISEIMLQQTQVATVIPYYQRFMASFPTITALAVASIDEVLNHWAGLGYYTRARNLHKAATIVVDEYQAEFPRDYDSVLALPGIGPSTAAAILAQALNQSHPVLDGNVKRVLCRYYAIEGWPGQRDIENCLWQKARVLTPENRAADYTQAIMDLGATLCTRSSPDCDHCPLESDCQARARNKVAALPTKRPKKSLPVRNKRFLLIRHTERGILMEKRPSTGIWGGLWSLPEADMAEDIAQVCYQRWKLEVNKIQDLPGFRHTFSHFHLDITPCSVTVDLVSPDIREAEQLQWYTQGDELAVAAPVRTILTQLIEKQPISA